MKKLNRADAISLMVIQTDFYKGDWLNLLPPLYKKAIHGVAPYLVFRSLMDATAQNISPDMAFFEKQLEGAGIKRQTISKHLNLFIKRGIVEKSSWDVDKRNSIYTFSETTFADFTPVLMQGVLNTALAFDRYLSSDGDITPRVLKLLVERETIESTNPAYHKMRSSYLREEARRIDEEYVKEQDEAK